MEKTLIEWCDHSWSPWRGCTKVSAGCLHCYAETLSKRNPKVLGEWGRGRPRVLAKNWGDPVRWNKRASVPVAVNWNHTDDFGEPAKRFYRPTVFPSLCDWLDEEVPIEWLARFLKLIHETPNLSWLLLTKRPENWGQRLAEVLKFKTDGTGKDGQFWQWLVEWFGGIAPQNVWVGTSVENQGMADKRIPVLLQIPATGRFLSVEPMLGPVDLGLDRIDDQCCFLHTKACIDFCDFACGGIGIRGRIHWVIFGGESGPGARACDLEWIRDGIRQCRFVGAAPFVKQLGSYLAGCRKANMKNLLSVNPDVVRTVHPKGGDPDEWPFDLRVREFPHRLL